MKSGPAYRKRRDPTISLINIVFLILIFFMIGGTLAPPVPPGLEFVETQDLDCCAGPTVLQIDQTGALTVRNEPLSSFAEYLDGLPADDRVVRLLPDRRLPASQLLTLVGQLEDEGAERIVVITQNTAS